MEKKATTTAETEAIVLASLVSPKTEKETRRVMKAAKFDPEEMFTDPTVRDSFLSYMIHGAGILGGYICQKRIEDLATPFVERHLARLIREYKRRMSERDRTLDEFETPGPDAEDPDCLFQNRWLRRGACGAIVSTSGVGKSSFSIQAAVHWAGGQECLGVRPLKPLKIGIFQSEDDEYDVANFRDRIRIGLTSVSEWTPEQIAAAESRVTFCALDGSTGARFVEHVRRKQMANHFDLIVINPLFAFFGGDLNDGNAMTAFLRHGIDPLIKDEATKCGCIIIHHTGKPNKDALNQGDAFKAYLGSGSGEFTNYIRSALVLTPWNNGKLPGVFDLIAAKHGDKLAWKGEDGKPTTKKTICYANRLPEFADKGMIYWVEPDAAQFAELKKTATTTPTASAAQNVDPAERCAKILAEHIRTKWTPLNRPLTDSGKGQKYWCCHTLTKQEAGGFSQSTRAKVYDVMFMNPGRFDLKIVRPNNRGNGYLVGLFGAAEPTAEATDFDALNPEQEPIV